MASISLYGSQPSGKGYYRLDITYTVGNGYITLNGATGYSTNGRYSGWDGYSRTHTFGFNGQTVNFTTSNCGFNSRGHTWAFTSTPTIYTSGTNTVSVTCNSGVGSMNGTYTSSSQISVGPAATTPTINASSVSNIGTTTANSSFSVANNGGAAIVDNYIDAAINNFSGVVSTIAASTDYEPLEEDWNELRVNVKKLRERLKEKYWDEIVYSDVEDMLYQVKHFSDCHFTESWLGTFYDYMNKGTDILDMNYKEMIEYSKTLEFDGAGHEIHSPQVEAWVERHKNKKSEK